MADPVGNDPNLLLRRALAGDESALAALFDGYRERLRRMIRLRLDGRLSGRVDSSDAPQATESIIPFDPASPEAPFRRGREAVS